MQGSISAEIAGNSERDEEERTMGKRQTVPHHVLQREELVGKRQRYRTAAKQTMVMGF